MGIHATCNVGQRVAAMVEIVRVRHSWEDGARRVDVVSLAGTDKRATMTVHDQGGNYFLLWIVCDNFNGKLNISC